jgi:hypothetical protein
MCRVDQAPCEEGAKSKYKSGSSVGIRVLLLCRGETRCGSNGVGDDPESTLARNVTVTPHSPNGDHHATRRDTVLVRSVSLFMVITILVTL